jgi:hypothetical protein
MTTPFASDAPRLHPKNVSRARAARDVSINDYAWAAGPHIFHNYVFSQTSPCREGASNSNVCRTFKSRSQYE